RRVLLVLDVLDARTAGEHADAKGRERRRRWRHHGGNAWSGRRLDRVIGVAVVRRHVLGIIVVIVGTRVVIPATNPYITAKPTMRAPGGTPGGPSEAHRRTAPDATAEMDAAADVGTPAGVNGPTEVGVAGLGGSALKQRGSSDDTAENERPEGSRGRRERRGRRRGARGDQRSRGESTGQTHHGGFALSKSLVWR